jgi:hypothetical protein
MLAKTADAQCYDIPQPVGHYLVLFCKISGEGLSAASIWCKQKGTKQTSVHGYEDEV